MLKEPKYHNDQHDLSTAWTIYYHIKGTNQQHQIRHQRFNSSRCAHINYGVPFRLLHTSLHFCRTYFHAGHFEDMTANVLCHPPRHSHKQYKELFCHVLFHLLSPFRHFLTWMLDRQCLLWLKIPQPFCQPLMERAAYHKVICCCFFCTFPLLSLSRV